MPSPSPSPSPGRGSGRRAEEVDLTDLEIIRRYSLAVRQDTADRSELLAVLRADLDRLERDRARTPATKGPAQRTAKRAPAATRSAGG